MSKQDEARALYDMKESDGWKIVNDWLDSAKDMAFSNLTSPTKSDTFEKVIENRATYNAYSKLQLVIDQMIERGKQK